MRVLIRPAELASDLVSAVNATDCLAARTGRDVVDVFVPWLRDRVDAPHAMTEVLFFLRAWASTHPGASATLLDD